jgi:hypothetical protein
VITVVFAMPISTVFNSPQALPLPPGLLLANRRSPSNFGSQAKRSERTDRRLAKKVKIDEPLKRDLDIDISVLRA